METLHYEDKCYKCGTPITGKYCVNCGHCHNQPRLDRAFIVDELASIFNFEKGIFFTIRELIIRPGENVDKFINKDRNRLVKPIIFLFICSLVYAVCQQVFEFENSYNQITNAETSYSQAIFIWITQNYGYSNVLMAFFIALVLLLFFRKYKYNYFETLIMLCFVMGMSMLILASFGILESFFGAPLFAVGGLFSTIYIAWSTGQFYKKKWYNYFIAFFAYLAGMLLFFGLATIIGMTLDHLL